MAEFLASSDPTTTSYTTTSYTPTPSYSIDVTNGLTWFVPPGASVPTPNSNTGSSTAGVSSFGSSGTSSSSKVSSSPHSSNVWATPTSSITFANGLAPDNSTATSLPVKHGSGSPRLSMNPTMFIVILAVCLTVAMVIIGLVTWCCIRRRRRRRTTRREQEQTLDERLGEMEQVGRGMVVPGRRFGGDLTTEEVRSAVILPSREPPALPARPRAPSTRWGSDDSEYDMIATDGSSITRTLSSRSVDTITSREPMSTIDENPFDHPAYTVHRPGRRDGPLENGTSTLSPVSGSGGTWLHPSQQTHWSSPTSTSAPRSPYDQISMTHNTFTAYSSAPSPIDTSSASRYSQNTTAPSPIEASSASQYSQYSRRAPSPAPTYATTTSHPSGSGRRPVSIISESTDRSEEDADLGTVMSTPGLRRGTTFIQHNDSLSPVGEPSVAAWRDGRRTKEVHLPPSYGQVYGDLS